MKQMILLFTLLLFGCNSTSDQKNQFNYKKNLNELIDSYVFLSENHDLLHIMMGEHEGSPVDSYQKYKNKITHLNNNFYIKPILLGLSDIIVSDNNLLINADKFDSLVDYYQIGIQMMIEGILKGYGYVGEIPQNSAEYESIKKLNF